MARKHDTLHPSENAKLKPHHPHTTHSLQTAAAEFAYAQLQHNVKDIVAAEAERKQRLEALLLQDQIDDLNDRIWEGKVEREEAESKLHTYKQQANADAETVARITKELKAKSKELDVLKIETSSLQSSSEDMSKLLTEKLALARELACLKPELEDLRSQSVSVQKLISEKLNLQRQLTTAQSELEDQTRCVKDLEEQRRQREHSADEDAVAQIQQLQKDLSKARRDLEKAKKNVNEDKTYSSDLSAQLEEERRGREEAQKLVASIRAEAESEKAVLEDKLDQFRTKLRSTKEQLKESEQELAKARKVSSQVTFAEPVKSKPSRKRKAAEPDSESAIGTPGDTGHAAKRSMRASSVVGEKSSFSLTPFLSKTGKVQSESPNGADQPIASVEDADSPSVSRKATGTLNTATDAKDILKPASVGKSNLRVKSTSSRHSKAATTSTLEKVIEEGEDGDENTIPNEEPEAIAEEKGGKEPIALLKSRQPNLKPRKSLASFASFREGSLQPEKRPSLQATQKKKKRKLVGSAGAKTLFDEDSDSEQQNEASDSTRFGRMGSLGPQTGSGLVAGGQRAFGNFGALTGFKTGLGGLRRQKAKGPAVTAADGFTFSPLKKERRAIKEASQGASEGTL